MPDPSLSQSSPSFLDDCRDRFEAAWQARPRIADYLASASGDAAQRQQLLRDLLLLDVQYRRLRGENPSSEEYLRDFPDESDLVEAVLKSDRDARNGSTVLASARPAAADSHEPTDDLPTWSSERFRVLRAHARGGLGEVYLAHDRELNREVALKEIQDRYVNHVTARRRFAAEAEITGNLEHPGIVPVYSLGRYPNSRPFYVMRFIRGESLRAAIDAFHCRARGPRARQPAIPAAVPTVSTRTESETETQFGDEMCDATASWHEGQTAARLPAPKLEEREAPAGDLGSLAFRQLMQRFIDVCQGVAYAHSRGVIHRDIKPANVMLGEFGETLVVDWGLARRIRQPADAPGAAHKSSLPGDDDTHEGEVVGTPAYMSPEQASGQVGILGPASDVYSLGATLYHILTGFPPAHGARDGEEMLDRTRRGEIPPARSVNSKTPKSLSAICAKAMALEPSSRYASAEALAADLEHWLADEPTCARREGPLARLARFGRKHRGVVGAMIVGLALVAGLSGVAAWREKGLRLAESAARSEAEANYASAKQAVDKYVETVTQADLLKEDRFKPLLKELLKDAAAFYERLMKESEGRPERLPDLASASFQVAYLGALRGSVDEAKRTYARTIEVFRELANTSPTATDNQRGLAKSHNNLALLQRDTGESQAALVNFQAALTILKKLAGANPTVNEYRRDVATNHLNQGLLQRDIGDSQAAMVSFREALAIRVELHAEHPTVTQNQSDLAESHAKLGLLQSETGDFSAAIFSYRTAMTIQTQLVAENPTVTVFQGDLARSHINLGNLQSLTADLPGALRSYEAALAIQTKLVVDNPTVTEYQFDKSKSHGSLGNVQSQMADVQGALRNYQAAIAIQTRLVAENPSVTGYQDGLAKGHYNLGNLQSDTGDFPAALGNYKAALAILSKHAAIAPTFTEYQIDLARSHANLGNLQLRTGDVQGANESYRTALAIQTKLAAENPTVTEFQSELARSHNNLAVLQDETGDSQAALVSYQTALAIRERLATEHPTITEYQTSLVESRSNLGNLQKHLGDVQGARQNYQAALACQTKIASDHPTVIAYQSHLATCHSNLGLFQSETGDSQAALASYQAALAIQTRLSVENPGVIELQSDLARSHFNLGNLQSAMRDSPSAILSYQTALAIQEKLATDNPDLPDLASDVGATLNNLALVQIDARTFAEARDGLRQAIVWQKKALSATPLHVRYRQFLANHYVNLARAARELHDADLEMEAGQGLAELEASDPRLVVLDERLAAVLAGARLNDDAERLAVAQHAYKRRRYALAARLCKDALDGDSSLADDRNSQHAYNAACAAVLAASGQGIDDPPPDDAAKATFRAQALDWLQAELDRWGKLIPIANPPGRQAIAQTMQHWQVDSDLAGIRGDAIDELPESEREPLKSLWKRVQETMDTAFREGS